MPGWVSRTLDRHDEMLTALMKEVYMLLGKFALAMILISAIIAGAVSWIFSRGKP